MVLLVVETTDILFATDSIPAILAITRDPFIVYTSNVFAILGLRSMYFALAGMMKLFPLPELRTVRGLDVYWRKDVVAGEVPRSHMGRAGSGGRRTWSFGAGFSSVSETSTT